MLFNQADLQVCDAKYVILHVSGMTERLLLCQKLSMTGMGMRNKGILKCPDPTVPVQDDEHSV